MSGARINYFISQSVIVKKNIILFFKNLGQKKYLFNLSLLTVFFVIYVLIVSFIKSYSQFKINNFESFLKSNELRNIKEYFFESLNSPYREFSYTVENNDTIESVLKKYNITNSEINKIASKIIKKKLSNIYAGTKINIVTKQDKGTNKIISIFYPINEITTVEIKKNKEDFSITKNI